MKKLIITSLILALAIINCKASNSTSPSDDKGSDSGSGGGGGVQTKSWKVIGTENFSDPHILYLAFTVSKDNMPYVAYSAQNIENGRAIAMRYDGSSWKNAGKKGFSLEEANYLSMVGADDGSIYLSYKEKLKEGRRELTVAKFDGKAWITDGPNTAISEGKILDTSIAVNKNNIPYVAYIDTENNTRRAVGKMFSSTGWIGLTVNDSYISTIYTEKISIAAYNDTPYVISEENFRISVKKYDGNSKWEIIGQKEIIDKSVDNINIAISDLGKIYIAYSTTENSSSFINVLEYNGTEWVQAGEKNFAKVDDRRFNSKRFFTVQGETPYIAFPDISNNGKATVMKLENNSWTTLGQRGFTSSEDIRNVNLASSKDGVIYIAYSNSLDGKVTVMAYK